MEGISHPFQLKLLLQKSEICINNTQEHYGHQTTQNNSFYTMLLLCGFLLFPVLYHYKFNIFEL